jgi:hypothetical protein
MKGMVSSTKVLDLVLWHPILVLALGILSYVGKGAAPLLNSLRVRQMEGFCFPCFPCSYGRLLQAGALK